MRRWPPCQDRHRICNRLTIAESHNNLGVALAAAGRTAEAIDAYRRGDPLS